MKTYLESMHEIVTVNTQFLRTSKGEYLIMANGVILVQKDGDRGYAEDARVWAQSQIVEIERAVAENQAQAQAVAPQGITARELHLTHELDMAYGRMTRLMTNHVYLLKTAAQALEKGRLDVTLERIQAVEKEMREEIARLATLSL